nr:LysR substrate-binding domain-containing protein [Burkholderia ambifaria]
MSEHLEIALLHAFVTVADNRSFTSAGHFLFRTQSAVSMQIKRLEALVGKRLLDRTGRDIRLTEEGEVLLSFAREMLKLNRAALASLAARPVEGTVRVGMPDDYAQVYLPGVLGQFASLYPHITLEIVGELSGTLLDMTERGELDLVLMTRQPQQDSGEVVSSIPLAWVGARDRFAYMQDPIPLALFPVGCVFREHALRTLSDAGKQWRVAYCGPSYAGGEIAVTSGLAITVVTENMVPPGWRILTEEEGFPKLPRADLVLLKGRTEFPAAVECLYNYLKAAVSDTDAVTDYHYPRDH